MFTPLIKRAAQLCHVDLEKEESLEKGRGGAASLRVIADHARATTFLIGDGVIPSNDGRGYVLRKILRRAFVTRILLGNTAPMIYMLIPKVIQECSSQYPDLPDSPERIEKIVYEEESRFDQTVKIGLARLDEDLAPLRAERRLAEHPEESKADLEAVFGSGVEWRALNLTSTQGTTGPKRFKLYDTFGLPL